VVDRIPICPNNPGRSGDGNAFAPRNNTDGLASRAGALDLVFVRLGDWFAFPKDYKKDLVA